MKCDHCSIEGVCNGEKNPRLCQLTDATRSDYNPSYFKALKPVGIMEKIGNFGSAIVELTTEGQVSDEVYEKRMNICRACDHYNSATTQCKLCTCILPIKCRVASEHCPIDRWTANSFLPNPPKCIPCNK